MEDACALAALAFLREAGISSLAVIGLETYDTPIPLANGKILKLDEVGPVLRQLLREEFWCRLEEPGAFVHVGYDYYMYVGVPHPCPAARALAGKLGLFVEEFRSPHSER